jgi:hypothetical protein
MSDLRKSIRQIEDISEESLLKRGSERDDEYE